MLQYILVLVVVGLIAGALARLLVPGPDPMSIPATILLGVVGAMLGGLVGRLLFNDNEPGWILAVLGSVVALLVYRKVRSRSATPTALR
ncbi:MAG TPA: GlsB/YeaQ/YmgE family stress response membrane protein [Actinomycetota bacterium]|nr:GlsB/YeaQ/YmgE family stress response membrane protein [Actinomycetota bacterium]